VLVYCALIFSPDRHIPHSSARERALPIHRGDTGAVGRLGRKDVKEGREGRKGGRGMKEVKEGQK
jgi:hypothetical protein